MDPLALACIAISAVMHATWNILLKSAGDPLRTATVGMAVASGVLVPCVLAGWLALGRPEIPPEAWLLGIVSGGVEVLYFVFLAAAYRRGDLSVVSPLARGSAPVFAVLIGVGLLGERLGPGAAIGVGLVIVGLLVVQRPWRLLRAATRANHGSAAGFALLTGAMIVTYTALDRVGVRLVPAWLYAGILWPTCAAGLVALAGVRAARGSPAAGALRDGPFLRPAVFGGLLTLGAYVLVLVALSRAELAIVAPLRESAVLITALWGVLRLREATDRREVVARISGSVLVLAGAATLAIAG